MTYEMFRTVFVAGAIGSVLMLLISVFLFLRFDIPMIIGELTGANARKGIAQILDKAGQSVANNQTGKLSRRVVSSLANHQSSSGNRAEKDITEKIITEELYQPGVELETALLEQEEAGLLGYGQQNETELLDDIQVDETALLKNVPEHMVNGTSAGGTASVWNVNQASSTVFLNSAVNQNTNLQRVSSGYDVCADSDFQIEYEITYTHTDEKIC